MYVLSEGCRVLIEVRKQAYQVEGLHGPLTDERLGDGGNTCGGRHNYFFSL
jgi:hypothetical protein